MYETLFDALLDSYTGIRKRKWTPSVLDEALSPDQVQVVGDVEAVVGKVAQTMQPTVGGDNKNISIAPDPKKPNWILIKGSNISRSFHKDSIGNEINGQKAKYPTSFMARLVSAWRPKTKEDTRYGDNPRQGFNGDSEEGDTGTVSVMDDEETSTSGTPEEGGPAEGGGVPDEPVKLSDPQKDTATEFWKRKGLGEKAVDAKIAALEKTINTPYSRAKISKALNELAGERPDQATEVKQQALNAFVAFMSLANKVKEVQLKDGSTARVVWSNALTAEEQKVRQIITVRGESGQKGVFVGRGDTLPVEGFKELQAFTSDWDQSNYGTTFGKAISAELGSATWGVRILDPNEDPKHLDREEFNEKPNVTRASSTVEKSGSQGTGQFTADWRGKLTEDVVQLQVAMWTGDNGAKAEAMAQLRKRMGAGKVLAEGDLDNLEASLLGSEFDAMLDFKRLEALGIPPVVVLQEALINAGTFTEHTLKRLGVGPETVLSVERPSEDSVMGQKADIVIKLKPGARLAPEWQKKVIEDEKTGELSLPISIKNQADLQKDTTIGSGSLNYAYAPANENWTAKEHMGRERALRLHNDMIAVLTEKRAITPEQGEAMKGAAERDRVNRAELEKKFGSFTDPNKADLQTQLRHMKQNPPTGITLAGRTAFLKNIDSIIEDLKNKKTGDPRMAALKVWQLNRMGYAASDSEYAAASTVNDMIFGSGTFDDEVIMRGCPGKLTLGSTHEVLAGVANMAFENGATLTLTSSTVKDEDGRAVFSNRVSTKKTGNGGRKLFIECKIKFAGLMGKALGLKTESAFPGQTDKSNEAVEGEGEEEGTTSLYNILSNLPDPDTGELEQMGRKVIALHHPFCLKVICQGEEFEGGYADKDKALKALDAIDALARERGETISASVKDYDSGRTFS